MTRPNHLPLFRSNQSRFGPIVKVASRITPSSDHFNERKMKMHLRGIWLRRLNQGMLLRRWKEAQLSLLDLFAFMTAVAVLLAILTPIVKLMISGNYSVAIIMGVVQIAAIVWAAGHGIAERRRLTKEAGRRLGVAFYGTLAWRWWPRVKSALFLLLFLGFQVAMFTGMLMSTELMVVFANMIQVTFYFARYAVKFFYGVYPSSVEIFEKGVITPQQVFVPWNRVELRPSQYFAGQHALVTLSPAGFGGQTYMVRFDDELKLSAEAAASEG